MKLEPWEDPDDEGYSTPCDDCTHCVGCGKETKGCRWGPWCFECNVARIRRIDASFARMEAAWRSKR